MLNQITNFVKKYNNILFTSLLVLGAALQFTADRVPAFKVAYLMVTLLALFVAVFGFTVKDVETDNFYEEEYQHLVELLTNGTRGADCSPEVVALLVEEDIDTIVKASCLELIEENETLASAIVDADKWGDFVSVSPEVLALAYSIVEEQASESLK
jgi:hypothetical protein